jgi:hypothetical protein
MSNTPSPELVAKVERFYVILVGQYEYLFTLPAFGSVPNYTQRAGCQDVRGPC